MLTRIMIALALILVTATASLAAAKKPGTHPSFDVYDGLDYGRGCCSPGDAWDMIRQRNRTASWG